MNLSSMRTGIILFVFIGSGLALWLAFRAKTIQKDEFDATKDLFI